MSRPTVQHVPAGRLRALAAMVAVVALAGACSSSKKPTSTSGTTGGSGGTGVDVKNFSFAPGTLDVSTGAKVTWTFDDPIGHNVHASDGSFQSGTLSGGQTYSFTFTKAGTYNYVCSIHPFMKGQIVVK